MTVRGIVEGLSIASSCLMVKEAIDATRHLVLINLDKSDLP
jgi:hypothetical protein